MIKTFEQFVNENFDDKRINRHTQSKVLFDNYDTDEDNDQLQIYWDEFMSDLEYDDKNNSECIVIGSVGRWNGRFNIEVSYFDYLEDAIKKCVENCDYCTITENDGVINILAIHHDGRNEFEIRKLTDIGKDAYYEEEGFDQNDLNHKEYFDKFDF
jgi:hypothetical protein